MKEQGLQAAPTAGLAGRLDAVDGLLGRVPDLSAVVCEVVAALNPLVADPGYDVSHSQPRWRDRIFVSFPDRRDEVGTLRLTESIVHEAMHLHLTNEEVRASLVAKPLERGYSPWRQTDREVGGLLHGMYVFVCIREFHHRLKARYHLGSEATRYIRDRIDCIDLELRAVEADALVTSLTPHGASLLRAWRRSALIEDGR